MIHGPADFLPYGRQLLDDEDIEEVVRVLRSDFLTQGPAIERFEKAVTAWCGASHGIAMSNGTATLHLACKALNVGHGDTVWTSPITFVASANCARYCGAKVDFVDVDPGTVNLCPDRLAAKLEQAEEKRHAAQGGGPPCISLASCAMDRIHALSQKYGFRIIEDAAHALGGTYLNERAGNRPWSTTWILIVHPVKIITSGEGGMITTNDPALAQRVSMLRTHGITRDASHMTSESHGPWYYQQIELGYNYRMTDIQAALGASQMKKLDAFAADALSRHRRSLRSSSRRFASAPASPRSEGRQRLAPLHDSAEPGQDQPHPP